LHPVCSESRTPDFHYLTMQNSASADHDEYAVTDGCPESVPRPEYFLAVHSYCCELEEGAIILELTTGSYVGVQADYLEHLRSCVRNWPNRRVTDRGETRASAKDCENVVAVLLAKGILTTTPTAKRAPAPCTPEAAFASRAVLAAGTGVSPIYQLPEFVLSLLTVWLRHHDKRLEALIERLSQRQQRLRRCRRPITPEEVKGRLASFLRLRVWFYTSDQHCLFDSLVLAVFLTKKMVPCTFVIGVSTRPFQAHSWVQFGDIVLNDTAEHVQTFTPVLAVGSTSTSTTCFATS
jgi:hypothetical protein